MKTWVKLYTEINHDADFCKLTWAQRGIWSAFLALAGQIDARDEDDHETGEMDTAENVGWHLRLTDAELADAVTTFTKLGMLDERDGILFLTNYGKRQGRAPSSARELVAERVKRHRAAQNVSRNEDVTSVKRGVTSTESESEADTEADTDEECGATAPAAEAATPAPTASVDDAASEQEPVKPKRNDPRSDPRSKHPAIQCVRGIMGGKYPPREMYDAILETLGERPDGVRAANCRKAWVERGFNRASWIWLTEWYPQGGPPAKAVPRNNGHGNGLAAVDEAIRKFAEGG